MLILVTVLGCAGAAGADVYSQHARHSIRLAFIELKSGLRHNNGELACSRMSLPMRQKIAGEIAREEGLVGLGCVAIVNRNGRATYVDVAASHIRTIDVRGPKAVALTTTGKACFERERDRWKLSVPSACGLRVQS